MAPLLGKGLRMAARPDTSARHVVDMPGPAAIARRAFSTLLIASVLPMGVFYLTYAMSGLRAAVGVTVAWYYAGLLLRVLQRRPLLGAALLGAGLLTIRAVVMFWTGSAFLYFLQPVAGTVATATAIAITAMTGRPLIDRLAHDFCPFSPDLSERLRENRFFHYASALWTLTYFINAAGTVWLLSRSSIGGFLVMKSVLSPLLSATAVLLSYLTFRLLMRKENVVIRWGHVQPVAV
ncbi:DUF3159 domain-containing protein [Jatrophihabitans telluris]|uniref:DUF3159 domain-containing protein n=1 Tax=Jatrophihabitans telluris TaxID=2038343 RepID=A0ABY4R0A6_9ACTN|nr:VC0807 family protein [Jatrophihabitans telluris]UQX88767.1 DUF3159 domain-containing protein [Jatrophihabitans telluris]